ncbi:MAG: SdiA-regulated domain-containing protein [Kiritimatiellae bacterium]|nr:SdiA-regulated domain-containing protein [Kiritimatiellia bacterium]
MSGPLLVVLLAGCTNVRRAEPPPERGGTLAGYVLQAGPLPIEAFTQNASGVTFDPNTRTLFVISNGPARLAELTLEGALKRVIELDHFGDTEDITYVKNNLYAILQEGRQSMCIVTIDATTTTLNERDATQIFFDTEPIDNNGPEGITYDAAGDRFFVVKEKGPRKLYVLPRYETDTDSPDMRHPWDIQKRAFGLTDLAGVYYHAESRHLLLLSQESRCVLECTEQGRALARLALRGGQAGLADDIPHPEGLTLDDRGRLYICSEPNLLYVFGKPGDSAAELKGPE